MKLALPFPKIRIATGFILIILGVLPRELPHVMLTIIFGCIILVIYRVPLKELAMKLLPLIPFFLFTFVLFPLLEGMNGLEKAFIYSGRLFFVSQILTFLFYKTSIDTFLKALHSYRIPAIFIDLAFFTLRFIDVFRGELKNMLLSLRSRGFYTGTWFNAKKYRILGNVLGSMLVRALNRSTRIQMGMLSRGYTGQMLTSDYEKFRWQLWAKTLFWIVLLLCIHVFYWIEGYRFEHIFFS